MSTAGTLNEREGNTRKGDTVGEGETLILMTHNSLCIILVTEPTLHESRGWLKAFAFSNTVHQYKGEETHKRDKGESQITRADTLNERAQHTKWRGRPRDRY